MSEHRECLYRSTTNGSCPRVWPSKVRHLQGQKNLDPRGVESKEKIRSLKASHDAALEELGGLEALMPGVPDQHGESDANSA